MRKILVVYIIFSLSLTLDAQVWKPFGNGIQSAPTAITNNDHFIVTANIVSSSGGERFHKINIWNGYYWQSLPAIKTDSTGIITSLSLFKGAIYIGGRFNQINSLDSSKNIIRWKDRKFESIPEIYRKSTSFNYVDGMSIYGNRLLIYGPIKNSSSVNGDDLVVYSGTEVVAMPLDFGSGADGNILDINADQADFLVIGGRINKINGLAASKLAYYSNNKWTRVTSNPVIPIKIAVYNSEIFFYGNELGKTGTGIYRVSGSGIDTINNGLSEISKIYDLIFVDGILYATGIFKLSDDFETEAWLIKYENNKWISAKNGNLLGVNKLRNYKNTLVSTGHFSTFHNVSLNHIAQYIQNAGVATGRVFFDKDKNCVFNNRDEQLSNMAIQVLPENIIVRPNDDGRFHTILEEGKHTFKIITEKYWYASNCKTDVIDVIIHKGQVNDSINFAMLQELNKKDLTIALTSNSGLAALKNRNNIYQISYTNKGSSDIIETKIVLKFDSNLKGLTAKPVPNKIEGDSAIWLIADLFSGESRRIYCEFELDASNNPETISLEASIGLQAGEVEQENNSSSLTQYLEEGDFEFKKQVFPSIGGDTAYLVDTADIVQYQISFANYTTDTIRNVYVIDTIGLNHSLTHVKELGASHPYTIQIFSGQPGSNIGIIVYTFSSIDLPPNPSKNPEIVNNRGYVSFEIGLKSNLTQGLVLTNQASVTFDFFDEEHTNWVYAIVDNSLVGINDNLKLKQFKVYPNPATHEITLDLPLGLDKPTLIIHDITGKIVEECTLMSNKVNVQSLTLGIYFIELSTDKEVYRSKFIKY